jgi:hypothetical protein
VIVEDQVVSRCARVEVDVNGVVVIAAEGSLPRWMLAREGRVVG